MKLPNKIALLIASLGVFLFAGIGFVTANPAYFITVPASATATTTPIFLSSSGVATTTALDAYGTGTNFGFQQNALIVQDSASSTSSILTIRYQYSIDGKNWADDNYNYPVATTTSPVSIGTYASYVWNAATTATTTKILNTPTPTRYVRAILSESGAAAGIWYTWAPAKQTP